MKTLARLLLPAALVFAAPAAAQQVVADVGFEGSEAVRYDAADDRYVVTNLGPRGPGNDGFISLVSPDGAVLDLKWIEGGVDGVSLHDPLGLFIRGDEIHVLDPKTVRVFDRRTGAALRTVDVPDAVRLNDLYVTEAGVAYVTDSGSNDAAGALYRIQADGTVQTFVARSADLNRVNGVAVTVDGLVVHGGLLSDVLTFRDADTAEIVREITLPTGRIDGIVALADGGLLVASQDGHNVYHVSAEGEARAVAGDIAVPAAIGYDTRRARLLVPQIVASSLSIFEIGEE